MDTSRVRVVPRGNILGGVLTLEFKVLFSRHLIIMA